MYIIVLAKILDTKKSKNGTLIHQIGGLSWFVNNHLKCSLLIVAIPITDGGLGSAFELKQRACDKLTKGS